MRDWILFSIAEFDTIFSDGAITPNCDLNSISLRPRSHSRSSYDRIGHSGIAEVELWSHRSIRSRSATAIVCGFPQMIAVGHCDLKIEVRSCWDRVKSDLVVVTSSWDLLDRVAIELRSTRSSWGRSCPTRCQVDQLDCDSITTRWWLDLVDPNSMLLRSECDLN